MKNFFLPSAPLAGAALALLLGACRPPPSSGWQGYLEAEFVHLASQLPGRLETLAVARGDRVEPGQPIAQLDSASELAALREAEDRVRSAQARREDLSKGLRPNEMASLQARLEQARAAAELSQRELTRLQDLFQTGATTASDLDRARLTHERNTSVIQELESELETARLGARTDAIAAAAAEVEAAAAARDRADWAVAQKSLAAPVAALVYDTLFRPGEFVPAGSPIVTLLPPENLKVRFFVPESDFSPLRAGENVRVSVSGRPPIDARISYLSPRPEYTPPVLYNRDNRAKLVFMVEALLDPTAARELHPGQPVDVTRATP